MSKQIHTIQSSDKNIFDKQVNTLLEIGCELSENTYKIIENDDGVIYSQGIEYDTTNTFIFLNKHGQIRLTRGLKNGKLRGISTTWYENGQKESEGFYIDGVLEGLSTEWFENGQEQAEITWEDGEINSRVEWDKDGSVVSTFKEKQDYNLILDDETWEKMKKLVEDNPGIDEHETWGKLLDERTELKKMNKD